MKLTPIQAPKRAPKDRGGPGNWKVKCIDDSGRFHEVRLGMCINYMERSYMPPSDPSKPQIDPNNLGISNTLLARVIGRVDRSGIGERLIVRRTNKPGWYLNCIVLNDNASYCMQRYVDPTDVVWADEPPTALASFFFSANPLWKDADTMLALQKHGSLSNDYVTAALNRIGNLQAADSPAFNLALNGVDEFRVSVAKAVKHGKLNPELLKESDADNQ